ncbi:MAG: hypothetical protein RDU76_05385 [Candidatus Edwardsbacteria bacterium]|nr:hypothetical protein [Candidatus Edwardsbacteria bacterium]
MRISVSVLCGLLFAVVSLPAQAQPVTTLRNAELFSRQYAQTDPAIHNISMDNSNFSFVAKENKGVPRGRLRTIGSGYAGMAIGATAFGTIGYGIGRALEMEPGEEFYGLATAAFTGIGLLTGGALGCSYGVHLSGRKYKKGSFWVALGATFIHNMIAGQIAKDLYSSKRSATLAALPYALAPLSVTAAYYIFSEELPDTAKQK